MIIPPSKRLGTVKEYYFSRKLKEIAAMREAGAQVINLGIGSPDLQPPPAATQALKDELGKEGCHKYQSYVGLPELRKAMADFYANGYRVKLDPKDEILPLMGSKEGIMHLSMAFLEEGDEALIPNPGYPTYRAVTRLAGAIPVEYKLSAARNWLPDLDALAQKDLSKVKLMWTNYPHMPTGAKADKGFFSALIAFAKEQKILICNDNPYSFILNENPQSILAIKGAKEVALELNSLSKAHNMAGWRVGMLLGKATYLQTVLRFKSNMDSGMFRPLQMAAVAALSESPAWYETLNTTYRKRQRSAFALLDKLDCTYDKNTSGLFVWAKVPATYKDGYELSDKLLQEAHVFITPGGIFGSQGDAYIRISLCSRQEIFAEAIDRIKTRFLRKLSEARTRTV